MYHGRTYQSINVLLLKSFLKILEIVAHFELKKINNSQFITISIMQSIFFLQILVHKICGKEQSASMVRISLIFPPH